MHVRRVDLDTDLAAFTITDSKRITDLCVKCHALNLLEDRVRGDLGDPGFGGDV